MSRLSAAYAEWRAENPEVYALFQRFAAQLASQGRRFGIKFLAERVRWEVRTTWAPDRQGFKMNNNHTAYIARDLIADMPALARLLTLRRLSDEDDDEAA